MFVSIAFISMVFVSSVVDSIIFVRVVFNNLYIFANTLFVKSNAPNNGNIYSRTPQSDQPLETATRWKQPPLGNGHPLETAIPWKRPPLGNGHCVTVCFFTYVYLTSFCNSTTSLIRPLYLGSVTWVAALEELYCSCFCWAKTAKTGN